MSSPGSKEETKSGSKVVVAVIDCLAIAASLASVFWLRSLDIVRDISPDLGAVFQPKLMLFYSIASVVLFPLFYFNRLYTNKVLTNRVDQYTQIVKSYLSFSLMLIVVLFFFQDTFFSVSERGYTLGLAITGVLFMSVGRSVVTYLVRRRHLIAEAEPVRVLVVGAGNAGEKFALRIVNDPELNVDNAWFVDDDPEKVGKKLLGYQVLGGVDRIAEHALNTGAEEIYVTMNSVEHDRLLAIVQACKNTGLPVRVTSKLLNIINNEGGLNKTDALGAMEIPQPYYFRPGLLAKRVMDICLSLAFLSVAIVPGIIVAALVKLTSKGPVFYKSERIGKRAQPFMMLKFRTMRVNDSTEHMEAAKQALKEGKHMGKVSNDPRITPIGGFLRKYSIDELPQFLNVLKGDMSIVGPRPCLDYEVELFSAWHKKRFLVLPGITGLWQVTGRQMEALDLHSAMMLDVYYAENFTIWMDLKILLKTIPVVLFGKGK